MLRTGLLATALGATACVAVDEPASSTDDARRIAEGYFGEHRAATAISTAVDDDSRPSMYGVNLEGGGFVVVDADASSPRILAYSDDGTIDLEHPVPGLAQWIAGTHRASDAVRIRKASNVPPPPPPPLPQICQIAGDEQHGQLLSTTWSTGCNYNQYTPASDDAGHCFHAPASAAMIALGQVVRHHHHDGPLYAYDFHMPDGPTGPGMEARGRMLAALGSLAHTLYSPYYSISGDVESTQALQTFGYDATFTALTTSMFDGVYGEIAAGRPVIVRASDPPEEQETMWVVDGTRRLLLDPPGCIPTPEQKVTYVHYNWGRGGLANGWYSQTMDTEYTDARWLYTAKPIGPD